MMNINTNLKKNLFITFFRSIGEIKFQDENYQDILDYLKTNLQEDQVFWNLDKLLGLIKNWYINKLEQKTNKKESEDEGKHIPKEPEIVKVTDNNEIEKVKKKIQNYHGDSKKLILKLIERRPNIIYDLQSIFEDSEV